MRMGIFVGTIGSGATLDEQVQQAVDTERDGFDSFWAAQVSGVDALTLFALAGQRTSRIELGTAVVPIYPRHPITLAQQALTASAAANGRLFLGIGLSHKVSMEGRFGLPYDRPARTMREYLSVLRPLVHEGSAEFSGDVYRVASTLQVPSAKPFPIGVAALGPRMLRIAGELAEGTVTWMVGPKTLDTHIVPRITAAARDAGRPQPRVCVGAPIAVTDDKDAALQTAARYFARYNELPSYRRMLDIEGVEHPADIAIVGNEEEVERQLRTLADAGATDLLASVFPVGDDRPASVARTRMLLKGLVGTI